jgi:outer membrane protein assembly factor BamE (lipoprotein component of BamABCDE complex)
MDYEMRSLNYNKTHGNRTLILTILFCFIFLISYSQNKVKKDDMFYLKIASLKPEMTKDEVRKVMGEPYKISFCFNEQKEFTEDMYYKTSVFIEKWYVITYQCIFINNKLKSLTQKELTFDSQNVQVVN